MGQVDGQYTRQRAGELAVKVVNSYLHHADLGAYAKARVEGTTTLPMGIQDHDWWVGLMQECIAKRDSYDQVATWLRQDLGMRVSLRPGDEAKGFEIYIKDFLYEGASKEQAQQYDEALLAHFAERDPEYPETD